MIIGCYTLDVYCDNFAAHKFEVTRISESTSVTGRYAQFTGETRGECLKRASRAGWEVSKNGDSLCKDCLLNKVKTNE
jgi:hypothetical protein